MTTYEQNRKKLQFFIRNFIIMLLISIIDKKLQKFNTKSNLHREVTMRKIA